MLELNGKCLAFHGPLLYEAKILRIWDAEKQTIHYADDDGKHEDAETLKLNIESIPLELVGEDCYFIHYQGWKPTWDEWIGSERIREANDENVALRKKLVQNAKETKKLQQQEQKKKKQSTPITGTGAGGLNKKRGSRGTAMTSGAGYDPLKNGNNSGILNSNMSRNGSSSKISDKNGNVNANGSGGYAQQYNNLLNRNLPKIIMHIPVKLKSVLVDDWESVTKDKKLCKLPRAKEQTINAILDNYKTDVSPDMSLVDQSLLEEYVLGLKLYFNEFLSILLLYRLEKLQYDEIRRKDKNDEEQTTQDLCNTYGSVHLLRLISILPELMSDTTMGAQSCQVIIKQSESLLLWMTVHSDDLFDITSRDADGDQYYINTSSQYEGLALGM